MTKLKHSNCDKAKQLQLWQNLKTQIITKHILNLGALGFGAGWLMSLGQQRGSC